MRCPKCACQEDKVIDSRSSREGSTIRRRRECLGCSHRFTTYEEIERARLMVIKHDGRREEFSRDKLFSGIQMACRKLSVPSDKMEALVDQIAEDITDKYEHEVPSMAVGERVMEGLRELDHVAYVRFASVYRGFQEATDFVQAVKKLEVRHDTATFRLPGL